MQTQKLNDQNSNINIRKENSKEIIERMINSS